MSKFIVPIQVPNLAQTPEDRFSNGFVAMYIKNGWHKLHIDDRETDVVLDRPLDGFVAETDILDVLETDSVLRAIEKLAARKTTPPITNITEIENRSYNDLQDLPVIPEFPADTGYGIIEGGIITWISGLDFVLSFTRYKIDGVIYSVPSQGFSIQEADTEFGRFDLPVLTREQTLLIKSGVPSGSPQIPSVDPVSEVGLSPIFLPVNATEPEAPGGGGIVSDDVYQENVEWTVSGISGAVFDPANTVRAQTGVLSVRWTNIQNNHTLNFRRPVIPVDISGYDSVGFWIYIETAMNKNHVLSMRFLDDAGVAVSNLVTVPVDKERINEWQFIALPINTFTFTSQLIRNVRLEWKRSGNAPATYPGLWLDNFRFQGGITPPAVSADVILSNEVTGAGQTGAPIDVKITEKAISNQLEVLFSDPDDELLIRDKNGILRRIKVSNLIPAIPQITAVLVRNLLQSLEGDDRLDASAIKNLPNLVGSFLSLTDTPDTYEEQGKKFLVVSEFEDGVSFESFDLVNVVDVTYAEFKALKDGFLLSVNTWYRITDYQTIHLIPNTVDVNIGPVEPLFVKAINVNRVESRVYSQTYPKDYIEYDPDVSTEGALSIKGLIRYRKDVNLVISAYYDWRTVLWRRWKFNGFDHEMGFTATDPFEIELLLTWSPNMTSTYLNQYRKWEIRFPQNFQHGEGLLHVTIRKGSISHRRPLLSCYTNQSNWSENELAGKAGPIIYCPERDAYVLMNIYDIGFPQIGLFLSRSANAYTLGNGLRINPGPEYIDVPTFYNNSVSQVELDRGCVNNVFLGPVMNFRLGGYSSNNTFGGGVITSSIEGESNNNLFLTVLEWSTLGTETINNVFEESRYLELYKYCYNNSFIPGRYNFIAPHTYIWNTTFYALNWGSIFEGVSVEGSFICITGGPRSDFKLSRLVRFSIIGYFNVDNLEIDKQLVSRYIYTKPDTTKSVGSLNIQDSVEPTGTVNILGYDTRGNVIKSDIGLDGMLPYNGIDGIEVNNRDITLGGFVMTATDDFKYNTFSWPENARESVKTMGLFYSFVKAVPVLGDKILLHFDRHVVVVEQDGSVYAPNGKPWIYLVANRSLRHVIVDHVRNAVFIGTTQRLSQFEHFINNGTDWDKTVLGSFWVIKVNLTSGLHMPEFEFRQGGTYFNNNTPNLARLALMPTGNLFFNSNHLIYDTEIHQGFYHFSIDGTTGAYRYSNTLPSSNLGGPGYQTCVDTVGCNQFILPLDVKTDSKNRLYQAWPISQRLGTKRGIVRFNLDVQTAFFPNFRVDDTWELPFTNFFGNITFNDGVNFLEVLEDDSIIAVKYRFDTTTYYAGSPMPHVMRFFEDATRDMEFGKSKEGEIGLNDFSTISVSAFRKVKTNLFEAVGTFVFDTDFGTITRNTIYINNDGRIPKNFEGFTSRDSEISQRLRYTSDLNTQISSTLRFLHPYKETVVIGGNFFTTVPLSLYFSPTNAEPVDTYQSYSFYRFGVRGTDRTGQHVLGYETYQGYKFTDNSFITKNFLERQSSLDRDFYLQLANQLSVDIQQAETNAKNYVDEVFAEISEDKPVFKTVGINIDGSGNTITTGLKGYGVIPYDCKIVSWYIVADTLGEIEIDVWINNTIPTGVNSVTGANRPRLTAQQVAFSDTLTGWDIQVSSGDIIAFNVVTVSNVTKINLVLKLELT
jgi:hypothetical protein